MDKKILADAIETFLKSADPDIDKIRDSIAYVAPHAGYVYSGRTAAVSYKAIATRKGLSEIETIVVIGPNHTGKGFPISISMEDWKTPIGIAENDRELSREISKRSDYIKIDESAHEDEHSIEVQLPFIKHLFPDKRLVFICMGDQSLRASELLSGAIISAANGLNRKIIIVASSDFNHYESAETARRKDTALFDAIKRLDAAAFNRLIGELDDSACGFGPITVAMLFAKQCGAKEGILLKYSNSGDVTGDYSSVVAYSSIALV